MRLGVTAAFHSEAMAPAAAEFSERLQEATFHTPGGARLVGDDGGAVHGPARASWPKP